MQYKNIIGHKLIIDSLKKNISNNCFAQSNLFVGICGVGKLISAETYCAALLCFNSKLSGEACVTCDSCLRFQNGNHPDIYKLSPEGAGEMISIRTLREIVYQSIIYAPTLSERKVYIIEKADRLGLDAANSLLKILEEPPNYAVFILTADSTNDMLPTILSRCRLTRFGTVDEEEISKALQTKFELTNEQLTSIVKFSEGAPGIAISLADNENCAAAMGKIYGFFNDLPEASRIEALALAENFRKLAQDIKINITVDQDKSSRTALASALILLAKSLQEALVLQLESETDKRMSVKRLRKGVQKTLEVRRAILANVNAQLATESLFISLYS